MSIGLEEPSMLDDDGDGLTNAEEIALGSDPNNPDTSGDGMWDGNKVMWEFDPTVSDDFARPAEEAGGRFAWTVDFEEEEDFIAGVLDGQQGWGGAGAAGIVSGEAFSGDRYVELPAQAGDAASAQKFFGMEDAKTVWVTSHVRAVPGRLPDVSAIEDPRAALVAVNVAGFLFAWDGARERWTGTGIRVEEGAWLRLDVGLDYANARWKLCVDRVLVLRDLGFRDPGLRTLTRLGVSGSTVEGAGATALDLVRAELQEPEGLDFSGDGLTNDEKRALGLDIFATDTSGDGIPDWWLVEHGLDALDPNIGDTDPFDTGLTVRQNFLLGTRPDLSDTDGDGWSDFEEYLAATDPLDPASAPEEDGMAGWTLAQVGGGLEPYAFRVDGEYRLLGSGVGTKGTADGFAFAYRQVSGDFEAVARVRRPQWVEPVPGEYPSWLSQNGLMARTSLDATAQYSALFSAPFWCWTRFRELPGQPAFGMTHKQVFPGGATYVRIRRFGDRFRHYLSDDGENWYLMSDVAIAMPEEIFVGMFVSSNATDLQLRGRLSEVSIVELEPGSWQDEGGPLDFDSFAWMGEWDGLGDPHDPALVSRAPKLEELHDAALQTPVVRELPGAAAVETVGGDPVIDRIRTGTEFDANSRVVRQIDAVGFGPAYTYDALNRVIRQTNADSGFRDFAYDRDHNVRQLVDENGTVHTFTYDALDRLLQHDLDPAVKTIANSPALPMLIGTTERRFEYDGLSRLTLAFDNNDPADPSTAWTVRRRYDSLGRLLEEDQNGVVVANAYDSAADSLNRSKLHFPGGGRVLEFAYDPLDKLVRIRNQDEIELTIEHQGCTPHHIQRQAAIRSDPDTVQVVVTEEVGFDGNRDPAWIMTQREQAFFPNFYAERDSNRDINSFSFEGGPFVWTELIYDSAGRANWSYFEVDTGEDFDFRELEITLSGRNEILSVTETTDWGADPEIVQDNIFNEVIERTNAPFQYNLSPGTGIRTADANHFYQWDGLNRLRAVWNRDTGDLIARYRYDAHPAVADGRRVEKTVENSGDLDGTIRFYYDGMHCIEERAVTNGVETLSRQYLYGYYADDILAMASDSNGDGILDRIHFYGKDFNNNVITLYEEDGEVAEYYRYDLFRAPLFFDGDGAPVEGSAAGNPFLFTGRRYEPETGLYYYRARYFDPINMEFISRDPLGFWGDPENLGNPMAYVGNRPWSRTDPTGLEGTSGLGPVPHWQFEITGIMGGVYDYPSFSPEFPGETYDPSSPVHQAYLEWRGLRMRRQGFERRLHSGRFGPRCEYYRLLDVLEGRGSVETREERDARLQRERERLEELKREEEEARQRLDRLKNLREMFRPSLMPGWHGGSEIQPYFERTPIPRRHRPCTPEPEIQPYFEGTPIDPSRLQPMDPPMMPSGNERSWHPRSVLVGLTGIMD